MDWPTVRTYPQDRLTRIRMPVGGIGTGCVSLGGRGQLVDWELFNRPAKGFCPDSFFAVHVRGSHLRETRVLEVGLDDADFEGPHGSPAPLAGLPRFREGSFAAAYPFGTVRMSDPDLPVTATVQMFNPLVPRDAEASGLPLASYVATLTNTGDEELVVSVCGSVQHVVGATQRADRTWELAAGNRFEVRRLDGATTLLGTGAGHDPASESTGTIALTAIGEASSLRTSWARRSWGDDLLEFWEDLAADGQLDEPDVPGRVPTGSLVLSRTLAPGESGTFPFLLTWHFPHRLGWGDPEVPVGNHYTSRYADAADVAAHAIPRLGELEAATVAFVESVADLPAVVQDAALSNLAVLKSPTCFRIEDGTFLAWEGTNDDTGSCHGSCTHVWNYQFALEPLFPELAWSMREVEFVHSLDDRGRMSFRAGLPLAERGAEWPTAAADGQMGAIVRLHRTWLADPDRDRLEQLWPGVRRAMEFAWIPLGWDADRDGLMEGCQHNTMDVEYYGPSGVNQSWYLAALAACVELAGVVGDHEFAATCAGVLASGATRTDEVLFNGDYYQQEVIAPGSEDRIAEGLRIRYDGDDPAVGSDDLVDPDLQIGPGCTADQLAGHTMAALGGLSTGLRRDHVSRALDSVLRHNHRADLVGHVNPRRAYALNDEAGLLNCTFPRGGRPARPFPYCDEVWTGIEYTAAVGLLVDGRADDAVRVVADVRARYDGRRRNPFDEVECGHHYARSMAAWGLVEAFRAWAAFHQGMTAKSRFPA
jgi:non-lysosomal glucosylceramidase